MYEEFEAWVLAKNDGSIPAERLQQLNAAPAGQIPNVPDSWYGPQGHSIWIPLLRHPAFQGNRESPRLHRAFAQLWGREDLWVTVDQGGLYLTGTAADQGAFTCVPGFHRIIRDWLESLPPGADPRQQDISELAKPIAGRAGDLVIWHHALPHGSSPNRNTVPRVVQYLTMFPSQQEVNPIWK